MRFLNPSMCVATGPNISFGGRNTGEGMKSGDVVSRVAFVHDLTGIRRTEEELKNRARRSARCWIRRLRRLSRWTSPD